ncbi:MAG: U32 family peptidase [Synechococcaceae cyanobacterium SM2_3_60]|nr:U32 family peptidase [Synechococcaceae cyanobacterium SM2_3_60]
MFRLQVLEPGQPGVRAAVANGADAVYFGLDQFNARMRAENFTLAMLPELMQWLHEQGAKGYLTLNTLIFTQELSDVEAYLRVAIESGVDAVIVQDVGLMRLIRHLSPDFPIHASTQMTVTSGAGVEWARQLGCDLVVLARECSLKDIEAIQASLTTPLPLEIFVHGALCVAYSGQCLTSEALGGRSANRGECAQACRMPYELVVDGQVKDLGERRYLLSPQDLAGVEVLPQLVKAGLACFKIEGRLKTPEYVASVTRIYRQALDQALANEVVHLSPAERYELEMSFSRGLYTGWLEGINNQKLVHARYAKKRGVYLGQVLAMATEQVKLQTRVPLSPGDGVVFSDGRHEVGGRIHAVERQGKQVWLRFGRHDLEWSQLRVGDHMWKTSDPNLEKTIRQSFKHSQPQPLSLEVRGALGEPLSLTARDPQGHRVSLRSEICLQTAHSQPLDTAKLEAQLGRLGNTPFYLGSLINHLAPGLMLPVSELNRLRRAVVEALIEERREGKPWTLNPAATWRDLLPAVPSHPAQRAPLLPLVLPLVRSLAQLDAVLATDLPQVYVELADPRANKEAVQRGQAAGKAVWIAPPRISKPNEQWTLKQVRGADGYLIRNYDHLAWCDEVPCVGDFSLNVANPLSAALYLERGLPRLTAAYDLTGEQLLDLAAACPPGSLEVTLHQHMPMFHMEHCVFCAFLSEGTDYTNCGRPCETHQVSLRDRVGSEHVLSADIGCRNTLFNATAQTGADYFTKLHAAGIAHFRIEFVQESAAEVSRTLALYEQLLRGELRGADLWRQLSAQGAVQQRLGVTHGTFERVSR